MHSPPPSALAHRGDHRAYPENTLQAFEAARRTGFQGIETDVRLSAKQELILFHDRVTRNGIPVANLSRQELATIAGYPIPSLQEALDTFPDIYWNIEIKTRAAAEIALPQLLRYTTTHRLLITSFRHDVVQVAANSSTALTCGLLCAHHPQSLKSWPSNPNLNTLVWDAEIVDAALLAAAQRVGFRQGVYGAKTRYEHEELIAWGADFLITDFPEYAGLA